MKKEEECSSSNKIINKASYPKYPTSENKKTLLLRSAGMPGWCRRLQKMATERRLYVERICLALLLSRRRRRYRHLAPSLGKQRTITWPIWDGSKRG